jgi:hypothetical protein
MQRVLLPPRPPTGGNAGSVADALGSVKCTAGDTRHNDVEKSQCVDEGVLLASEESHYNLIIFTISTHMTHATGTTQHDNSKSSEMCPRAD